MKREYSLITILIPVYNMEPYLERCLESVVGQTYGNLDIILVDDGSTDASPQIIKRYEAMDARIHVITKKNEGIGYAVKDGLRIARGDYIAFVDSDDTVDLNLYEKVAECIARYDPDIVQFGIKRFHEKGGELQTEPPGFTSLNGNSQIVKCHFERIRNPSLAFRAFRRRLLDDLFLLNQNVGLDELITAQVIDRAETMRGADGVFYHVFMRENSVSRDIYGGTAISQYFTLYSAMMKLDFQNKAIRTYIILKYINLMYTLGLHIYIEEGANAAKRFLFKGQLEECYQRIRGSNELRHAGIYVRIKAYFLARRWTLLFALALLKIRKKVPSY